MALEEVPVCPVCQSHEFTLYLTCQDHTATQETFQLQRCSQCAFVLTSPRPDSRSVAGYYLSEKYISHTSQSGGLLNSVYRFARRFTVRWKRRLITEYSMPSNLLDYGCGTGEFLADCSANGWVSYGIEPSAAARSNTSKPGGMTVLQSIDQLPSIKFNVITLWHVLEHVSDLQATIYQLKELLTENGTLFVAVPNHHAYDASIYREHWAAYDVPRHLWHFSRENMKQLMLRSRLTIREIYPMKLDAFYISIMSQKYAEGKHSIPGFLKAIWIAILSNKSARKSSDYSSLIYVIQK